MRETVTYIKTAEKQKASLESILISLPIIRKEALSIFCGVPIKDLTYKGKSYLEVPKVKEQLEEWIIAGMALDFLICKGKEVILGISLEEKDFGNEMTNEEAFEKLPGISVLTIYIEETVNQRMGNMLEQWIGKKLEEEKSGPCTYQSFSIRTQLQPVLEKKRMLKVRTLYEGYRGMQIEKKCYESTMYGADCGIIKGWYVSKEGKVRQGMFCGSEGNRIIMEELLWEKNCIEKKHRKASPFSERIKNLNSNYSTSATHNIKQIRKFARNPITQYLESYPKELEELKGILFEREYTSEELTYQQAAVIIYRMLQSEETKEKGRKALCLMATPLLVGYERRLLKSEN